MSVSSSRRPVRYVIAVLAWALVTGCLVGLGPGPAQARVPKAAFRYTAAIEPLARYVGQTTCSPAAKAGTTAFANMLLRTYPSSRNLGISRSCSVGGRSEHKEGRAFDWGVSVHDPGDRASVDALMTWLLKTDAYGNRHALARRLGIQYMIWNRRIWGAYAAGSGWRRYTGANPHTDHVHFSFSWAGARKKSSFWNPRTFPNSSGSAPTPTERPGKPVPDGPTYDRPSDRHDWPDPRPDERVRVPRAIPEPRSPRTLASAAPLVVERVKVPARRASGVRTRKALVAGRRYLIEVTGSYRYDRSPGSLADAECSTRAGASWWQRERSLRAEEWYADHLDLYVDGHDLYAQADEGHSCDDRGHTYRWVYQPERTGRVPLVVWDPDDYGDNSGRLVVRVLDLGAQRDSMTWPVPANARSGATSPGLLRGGQAYRVTVAGTWRDGRGGTADAACALALGGTWRRDAAYGMVAGDWGDSLSPRLRRVATAPSSGAPECDSANSYTYVFKPERSTPLNIRVGDPGGHADNTGGLRVTVRPYEGSTRPPSTAPSPSPDSPSPVPVPVPTQPLPVPLPAPVVRPERLQVDSRAAEPVRTEQEYPAGTTLRVTASGTYFMRASRDWIVADAECTVTDHDRYWRPSRYEGSFAGRTSPLGDLAVNGRIVEWDSGDRGPCDWNDHSYTYDLKTHEDGPLWFVVADDQYDDNRGVLEVEVALR